MLRDSQHFIFCSCIKYSGVKSSCINVADAFYNHTLFWHVANYIYHIWNLSAITPKTKGLRSMSESVQAKFGTNWTLLIFETGTSQIVSV